MANLQALRELLAWMREENVLYARDGELELRLPRSPKLPAPIARPPGVEEQNGQPSTADESPPTEEDNGRAFIEDILHSSGGDPTPFIMAMQKRRAA